MDKIAGYGIRSAAALKQADQLRLDNITVAYPQQAAAIAHF
jgi:hypothetical protein